MKEIVALKPKMCSYFNNDYVNKKTKVARNHIIKQEVKF